MPHPGWTLQGRSARRAGGTAEVHSEPGELGLWRFAALGLVVLCLALVMLVVPLPTLVQARQWVAAAGVAAPLAYVLGYALAALLFAPRPVLSALGGLLFGPAVGTCLAVAGATAAAVLGFAVGRAFRGDPWVGRRPEGRLRRLDEWLARHGLLAVVYLRLLPVVPFAVVNYGCGLSSVRTPHFIVGTAVGCLPATVLVVAAGSAANTPFSPAFYVPLAVAALLGAVSVVVAHIIRRRRPSAAEGRNPR
jgi:uncharacterized membrane protein YdjX (TVP38/TMEM64 family)